MHTKKLVLWNLANSLLSSLLLILLHEHITLKQVKHNTIITDADSTVCDKRSSNVSSYGHLSLLL